MKTAAVWSQLCAVQYMCVNACTSVLTVSCLAPHDSSDTVKAGISDTTTALSVEHTD
jgi:hypothetical protein